MAPQAILLSFEENAPVQLSATFFLGFESLDDTDIGVCRCLFLFIYSSDDFFLAAMSRGSGRQTDVHEFAIGFSADLCKIRIDETIDPESGS